MILSIASQNRVALADDDLLGRIGIENEAKAFRHRNLGPGLIDRGAPRTAPPDGHLDGSPITSVARSSFSLDYNVIITHGVYNPLIWVGRIRFRFDAETKKPQQEKAEKQLR